MWPSARLAPNIRFKSANQVWMALCKVGEIQRPSTRGPMFLPQEPKLGNAGERRCLARSPGVAQMVGVPRPGASRAFSMVCLRKCLALSRQRVVDSPAKSRDRPALRSRKRKRFRPCADCGRSSEIMSRDGRAARSESEQQRLLVSGAA